MTTPAALNPALPMATLDASVGTGPDRLRRQAEAFEAMFLNALLTPVFQTIPTDGPFGGGSAEETWRGLLVERYAEGIARRGGLGLADTVHRQLLAAQEEGQA